MLPITRGWLSILRLGLLISTFGWGISFFLTVDSWSGAVERLYQMGADPIEYQPMLAYWLKMASAVFGCIGIVSALAFIWPNRFETIIQLLAPFHILVGVTLVVAAWSNGLVPQQHRTFPFDISFCFVVAGLIGAPLINTWNKQGSLKAKRVASERG